MVSARLLPFWVPIYSPAPGAQRSLLTFSPHLPPILHMPSNQPPHNNQCQGKQAMTGSSGCRPFPSPMAPFAAHPFHSNPKVTEHTTKLCVPRSLFPGPQHHTQLILLPSILSILFSFATVGNQQAVSAKERLLHRKSTSDLHSSFSPCLTNCNLLEKFCQASQILHCTKWSLCCRGEPAIYTWFVSILMY